MTEKEMYDHDERIFQQLLQEWGVIPSNHKEKLIVLNNGIGDHFMFKMLLPEIREKYIETDIVLATAYPEAFIDEKDIKLISIADAKRTCDISKHDVYKFCEDNKWNGNLLDAFRKLHL